MFVGKEQRKHYCSYLGNVKIFCTCSVVTGNNFIFLYLLHVLLVRSYSDSVSALHKICIRHISKKRARKYRDDNGYFVWLPLLGRRRGCVFVFFGVVVVGPMQEDTGGVARLLLLAVRRYRAKWEKEMWVDPSLDQNTNEANWSN